MARASRSSLPDGFFHTFARGVAGLRIFRDDEDRSAFVSILELCERRHAWTCHAFSLLSTHYHLVVETTRQNLSEGMHRLNGRYAGHFNRRHGLAGHAFAERFSTRSIAGEEYLYDACEYVLLNPVRAGLCERAEDWPWSFTRFAKAGRGRPATATPRPVPRQNGP